jgi:hypothetical protein
MVFGTGLDIAIGVLLCMALMQYAQLIDKKRSAKTFAWIGGGAVSFILAGVFELTPYVSVWVTQYGINYGYALFAIIGWLLILVGTLKLLYELIAE